MAWRALAGWALIFCLVAPLIPLAIWSFARGWYFPDLLPQVWTLAAWDYALSDASGVLGALWTTTGIAAASALLALCLGLPAGRALALKRFRGKGAVRLLILAPVIVPGIAVVFGVHGIFLWAGLANTTAGVILVHLIPTLPYAVLAMEGVFSAFDDAYEAQARSLGASPAQVFRHVTLPAIMPGIVIGGLFAFLVSWSQYILTLTIGGGRVTTLPLLLFSFASSGRNDLAGAIAMIYILPGVVMVALAARHLTGRGAALAGAGAGRL